jgi:hypothetical protein
MISLVCVRGLPIRGSMLATYKGVWWASSMLATNKKVCIASVGKLIVHEMKGSRNQQIDLHRGSQSFGPGVVSLNAFAVCGIRKPPLEAPHSDRHPSIFWPHIVAYRISWSWGKREAEGERREVGAFAIRSSLRSGHRLNPFSLLYLCKVLTFALCQL